MTSKTLSVSLGRARLPKALARELMLLKPGLRGRVVALVLIAQVSRLDLQKLVSSQDQLRRLGVLINQSLRLSVGRDVDHRALAAAVQLIKSLHA